MPSSIGQLVFTRSFTAEEYTCLSRGLIPEVMEDKWFIFMEADRLYFHRSWTDHASTG